MTNYQNKCFISSAIKALEIKRKFKLYTSEKEYAKTENENAEIKKCLCTELSESFNTVLNAPKNVKSTTFFNKLFTEDSIENFFLKSIFGFLGGILVTYVCFMFLVFSLNFSLKRATYICMGLGIILSLGLAFSVRIRCTVFLCIPQLFSKRGRQALLAYAFILALSGPAKNTLHNVEVMSESLACTQEQLKQIENELVKCVQTPNAAAKKSVEKLLEKITFAVKDFKNFILELYKNCFDILETVLHAQKWLYSITFLCQKKMGKPAHRCLNLLTETRENCEASVVPFTPWKQLCQIRPGGEEIICSAKATSVCMRSDVTESLPVLKLQKQIKYFKHRAMNIFFVSIEAHQTYSQTNRTYTYHEEYQGMATEIRQKTDQFLQYFDFMSVIFGIFILILFVKVIIYRHKFLTEDHYDNRYITADFVDIDNTRAAFYMDTLLPLAPKERMQYIKVSSFRLVPCERVRLLSSFVFLIFATFKIVIHMLTDSSLYWILSTVRRNERLLYMSTLREEEPSLTVRVVGDGLVAALIRNVSAAVKRESTLSKLDPTPCLPDPVPPDWNRYYQIIALVIICWLLALCEPYGLRLRHTVMVTYHPDRARERAIWLYNKIISNRISFVKISRRKLRRKYKDVSLEDTFSYKFMRKASSTKCLLCKTTVKNSDSCVKCSTVKCVGFYCTPCFECLKICSICKDPTEYGDFSDLSEEKQAVAPRFILVSPKGFANSSGVGIVRGEGTEVVGLNGIAINEKTGSFKEEIKGNSLTSNVTRFADQFEKQMIDSSEEENLCKSPRKKTGAQKLVRNREKKKEGLLLNIKKTNIKLKEGTEDQKTKMKSLEGFVQPTFIFRAIQYCRSKIPAFRPLKSLSDFESSDWDQDSTLITEGSSVEIKLSDFEKTDEENNRECGKKSRSALQMTSRKKEGKDNGSDNLKKSGRQMQKVRLFKKMSPRGLDSLTQFNCNFENSENASGGKSSLKPDPYFKVHKKGSEDCISSNFTATSFLKLIDSCEKLTKERKMTNSGASVNTKKRDSGALINEYVEETMKDETKLDIRNTRTEISDSPSTVHLQKQCIRFKPPDSKRLQTFPFIDPMNVHEFDPGEDHEEESEFRKETTTDINSEEDLKKKIGRKSRLHMVEATTPTAPYTLSHTRVCFQATDSSDSPAESIRICLKEETMDSSTESDCQFYKESYRPSEILLKPERTNSDIKRASAQMNLHINTNKSANLYSVETDSSNDKFLAVKPSRRVRKKQKKIKQIEEESGIVLKLSATSSRTKESKRNDFLNSDVVQFIEKPVREGKSLEESESSDTDNVPARKPAPAVFQSDEEFLELSKRRNCSKMENEPNKSDSEYFSLAIDSLPGFHSCEKNGDFFKPFTDWE